MGLLTIGTPLNWPETKNHADIIRRRGIHQLLKTIRDFQGRQNDPLLWGDEIEYLIVSYHDNAQLSTRACEILDELNEDKDKETNWCPEYGRFMLEGTPGSPYSSSIEGLLQVESNMSYRRRQAIEHLKPYEKLITMPSYPRFGCKNFLDFPKEESFRYTLSKQIPDNISNPHPRYHYIIENLIYRHGKSIEIVAPVFQDQLTTVKEIKFDSASLGAGCCCLQLTFQAPSADEARFLYDRLLPLAPIFQALSNNTSIVGGMLYEYDNRWNLLEQSTDDRTPGELGKEPLQPGEQLVNKTRYGSASLYISNDPEFHPSYNDLNVPINKDILTHLESSGMDAALATHFSHLFQRDPLLIFNEQADSDASLEGTDYFENLQSTNWNTVRFKPPPDDEIGWRVEFRPLEVQLTDFENAAFAVVVNLLVRTILKFRPNFYMPISLVDFNMKEARKNDAVNQGKFYFRSDILNENSIKSKPQTKSINSIINGDSQFDGILPLIEKNLETSEVKTEVLEKLKPYIDFIRNRASGKAITGAQYMRQFVQSHPTYQQDSCVSPTINDDLIQHISGLRYNATSPLFDYIPEKSK